MKASVELGKYSSVDERVNHASSFSMKLTPFVHGGMEMRPLVRDYLDRQNRHGVDEYILSILGLQVVE